MYFSAVTTHAGEMRVIGRHRTPRTPPRLKRRFPLARSYRAINGWRPIVCALVPRDMAVRVG